MLILNGKELEQTPHLIVSFGGGNGGFSYHYRYIRVSEVESGTLRATGFSVPPSLLKEKNIFAKTDKAIHCFILVNNGKAFRDEIRDLLLKGSVAKARKLALDSNGKSGNPYTEPIIDIPRQRIVACGNWMYTGPDLSKVLEDYTICFDENFRNTPVVWNEEEQSFKTRAEAQARLDELPDNDGMYVVHRTEEIV